MNDLEAAVNALYLYMLLYIFRLVFHYTAVTLFAKMFQGRK